MEQIALDCLKLKHLKQKGFIIGDEFIRKTDSFDSRLLQK
jgi:hypothetical protein